MQDNIRSYIEREFENAPKSRKVEELKEELCANLLDKYQDLVANGKTEVEAYNTVVNSIGDVSELIAGVQEPVAAGAVTAQQRSRRALRTAFAVGLYIISPFMVLLFMGGDFGTPSVAGILVMFGCIAVATGLLVYNFMTRPVYHKKDETMVEEFKEWRVRSGNQKRAMRAFFAGFWAITIVIYLAVSFWFQSWAYSWMLFLVALAISFIVGGVFLLKGDVPDKK